MHVDQALVLEAARGDKVAFTALYDALARPVYAFLVALVKRREEAEDALHDAFLSAWTRLPSLREAERFVPWLFQIARNAALSGLRKRRPEGLVDEPPAPDAAGTDESAALLAPLDPDVRAVLLLRYVVGWSVEETAGALGKSPATVKRRAAEGLERLRVRLERSAR
jgi:RNA polymerase sigma-70 factor (ECF subfamily)